jgi:hypothetical protein
MTEGEPPEVAGRGARQACLDSGEAICLFAFVERADALWPPFPDGALGDRLAMRPMGSIAALVGIVPLADYCGDDAERHLADVAWLAPRVRHHAELVKWAMRESPVFPAPFGTLYANFENLDAFLRAHETTISGFLREVADKEEWELRAGAEFDSPDALDELACRAWPGWREMSKGARYLRLCRDRNALLDFGRAEAAALVRGFIDELAPLTTAIRQHGARRSPPNRAEPIVRCALLVPKASVDALRERIPEIAARATRQHVAIALSGPWPPFSFRPDLNAPN